MSAAEFGFDAVLFSSKGWRAERRSFRQNPSPSDSGSGVPIPMARSGSGAEQWAIVV